MRTLLLAAALGLGACATAAGPRPPAAGRPAPPAFVKDDYEGALALARERGVPLFVDAWAPWCHTCLSMHANVFSDPRLGAHAARFVWLSIDTEKERNAAFLERHPQRVWPTLLVIDPRDERPVLRWLGSANLEQLEALLDDAERASRGGAEGADALLARADRLYGGGDAEGAAAVLAELLAQAPEGWPRRSRAVETLLMARAFGAGDRAGCAALALRELGGLPRSPSWANVASLGLYCAIAADEPDPGLVRPLAEAARSALGSPAIELAADDRSGLYESLVLAQELLGDEAARRALAGEWYAFLEAESTRAPDARARAVFDSHLTSAALAMGEPLRAVPALQATERALPDDYNAPARLALLYAEAGRLDDALAANGRALALVYGPRRARVLNDRGDILASRGEREAARAAWTEALALAERLPESQRPRRERERALARLAE